MVLTLVGAAFVMGLVGGPHCVAMCGTACAGVIRVVRRSDPPPRHASLPFHAGRVVGYAAAGAIAAQAVEGLAWMGNHSAALRPAWTLMHLAVLAWGLSLLLLGRQPVLVGTAGRTLWNRVRPWAPRLGGTFTAGLLWACMPCGLLYSALLAASLSGGAVAGALSMALFAAGSAISLMGAPLAFDRMRGPRGATRDIRGTRVAGALVMLAAAWGLWMDLAQRIALWCGLG